MEVAMLAVILRCSREGAQRNRHVVFCVLLMFDSGAVSAWCRVTSASLEHTLAVATRGHRALFPPTC